ncbi:uncharacterized protein EV154DRAFT_509546 [Mucor mucedo]|uniref:uncharacterized protein n=1 Tax=Mucor mucedo TaxID=29922 RepID=UPI00221F2667|nr:uncharacterized protein EV154DRAFT_509546 [Mucor mucedo]KAI7891083.1 hypothetical protein EV154DRAFT_509546 [Mucor mucedo]
MAGGGATPPQTVFLLSAPAEKRQSGRFAVVRLDCGASFCWGFLMVGSAFPPSWRKGLKMDCTSYGFPLRCRRVTPLRSTTTRVGFFLRRFLIGGGGGSSSAAPAAPPPRPASPGSAGSFVSLASLPPFLRFRLLLPPNLPPALPLLSPT